MKERNITAKWESLKRKIGTWFYNIKVCLYNKLPKRKKPLSNKRKNAHKKELLCIWSVLIIPLINLCIFWVYGTIQSFPIAFESYDVSGNITGYSFANFEYLFHSFTSPNSLVVESLLNNLKYWSLSFFVLTPLSFFMGFFLYKKVWGYRIFRYVFFFPLIMSSVVISVFFKNLVGPGGQIQYIIKILTGNDGVLLLADSRYAMHTMLFYNFYTGLTGNLIYWLAAFARIPVDIIEAGKLDGLNTLKEFRYIVFPITWPFLATMLMLMVTGILTSNGATLLLTQGAYGTYDLGYYEYTLTVSGSKSDQAIAGAIGLLKGIIVLPITLIVYRLVDRIETVEF